MKWLVEYADEAAGMVRYDTWETEAHSREGALANFRKEFKNAGPGFFSIGVREKTPLDISKR